MKGRFWRLGLRNLPESGWAESYSHLISKGAAWGREGVSESAEIGWRLFGRMWYVRAPARRKASSFLLELDVFLDIVPFVDDLKIVGHRVLALGARADVVHMQMAIERPQRLVTQRTGLVFAVRIRD